MEMEPVLSLSIVLLAVLYVQVKAALNARVDMLYTEVLVVFKATSIRIRRIFVFSVIKSNVAVLCVPLIIKV